jgi:hypothetical protein
LIEESTSQGKSTVNVKDDLFSHLPVQVSEEGFDLYDGLGGYFQDNVEFEGKKATMEVTLLDLPQVLQIQLQVSALDRNKDYNVNFWDSEYNSIARRSNLISHKHMSSLRRVFIWIDGWKMPIQIKELGQRRSKVASQLAGIASMHLLRSMYVNWASSTCGEITY